MRGTVDIVASIFAICSLIQYSEQKTNLSSEIIKDRQGSGGEAVESLCFLYTTPRDLDAAFTLALVAWKGGLEAHSRAAGGAARRPAAPGGTRLLRHIHDSGRNPGRVA